MTWKDARDQCKSLSDFEATVDLASIHSEQEQQFAKGMKQLYTFHDINNRIVISRIVL